MRIEGLSVRDYAFRWTAGGCPLQQWASGAIGITPAVIQHVEGLLTKADQPDDREGLSQLLAYLREHEGAPASRYVPDK